MDTLQVEAGGLTFAPMAIPPREIFIEIAQLGDTIRVTAIDGATGLEASVIGPAAASKADLEKLAVRKLERLLAGEEAPPPPPPRPGKIV